MLPVASFAQSLDRALELKKETSRAAIAAQQRIDALDDATREALADYRAATEEAAALAIYNRQLERTVESQAETLASLERQIEEIEVTKRQVVPFLDRMLSVLSEFVALDKPFLKAERALRLEALETLRNRTDASLAEKFRRVFEAYQIEAGYGRTISADRMTLTLDGTPTTVDVLRFGRVGLYYLTLDRLRAGMWDPETKEWQSLDNAYRHAVNEGLSMARKEAPPDLVRLPIVVRGSASAARGQGG